MANILLAETELRLKRTVLRAHPYYYLIDICNVCNLRCPLCPTGNDTLGACRGSCAFDEYRQILDRVKRYALVVSLYNHGEPFLNKDIFEIIEYTAHNNITTQVSSNFNWPDPRRSRGPSCARDWSTSRSPSTASPRRATASIASAATSPRSSRTCRPCSPRGRTLRSKTPFVEWQFVVFKHNEHEIEQARELAARWGVDLIRFVAPGIQPESMGDRDLRDKWMPKDPLFLERDPAIAAERGYLYDRTCFYLYRSMAIYHGGGVTPCCFTHERRHDFGNILEHSVRGDLEQPSLSLGANAVQQPARAGRARECRV